MLVFMIHMCCDLSSPSHISCLPSLGYGSLPHRLGCNFSHRLHVSSFLALLWEVQPPAPDQGSPGNLAGPLPGPTPLQSQKRKSEFEVRGFEDSYHSLQMRAQSG